MKRRPERQSGAAGASFPLPIATWAVTGRSPGASGAPRAQQEAKLEARSTLRNHVNIGLPVRPRTLEIARCGRARGMTLEVRGLDGPLSTVELSPRMKRAARMMQECLRTPDEPPTGSHGA